MFLVNVCKATVIQRADRELVLGRHEHNHRDKLMLEDNRCTLSKPSKSGEPCKRDQLHKTKTAPSDPKSLDYESDEEDLPEGFLRRDVLVRGRLHLVFVADKLLLILLHAKTCYVDRGPIHAVVNDQHLCPERGTRRANTPGIYIISKKLKEDYRGVVKEILRVLPNQPSVRKITVDFERAMWSTFHRLLPEPLIIGCAFHCTQALWRKELGPQQVYIKNRSLHRLVRRLLALFFEEKIPQLTKAVGIRPPGAYFNNQAVKINNDKEGWHHGLNRRAQGKSKIPQYFLIELLFKEAKRRRQPNIKARLFNAWEKFEEGDISAKCLLKKASHIIVSSITFGLSFTPLNPCPANLLAKVPNVSGRYDKYMLAAFERPLFKILLNLLAEAPPVVFQKNNW
ncbi:hypothetical protein pdam_00008360, partial [Pocillopora damicornis]